MKVREWLPTLPAMSVSLATTVWVPWASDVGVKLHVPLASAVAVPRVVVPSVSVTTALASPEPVSVSTLVMWSEFELPLSVPSASVTLAATVS